jgi:hypothetical protein
LPRIGGCAAGASGKAATAHNRRDLLLAIVGILATMMQVLLAARVLALGVSLLLAGCSSPICASAKCPTATFDVRALDDSTVTWTLQGLAGEATSAVVPQPPAGGDCSFQFTKGSIYSPRGDAGAEPLIQGFFVLVCTDGDRGMFDFVVSQLGDPRLWSVGTFTLAGANGSVGSDYSPFPATAGAVASGCTVATLNGLVMTVTVETATGGAAPYPKLVTDDFERTFRFSFDTSTVTPTTSVGGPCDYPLTAQVSLHLTQTAADYVYDPNARCICE